MRHHVSENGALLERAGEVREDAAFLSAPKPVAPGGGRRLTYRAVVGQADVPGQNRRIYPRSEWSRVVERANAVQCPKGMLGGAVDHVEHQHAGNLRDKCILWHALKLEADGMVTGEFSVVEQHDRGRNLLAWIRAGGAVGFSTYGRARAHEPTHAEREKYRLGDDDAVVVDAWELLAIDAVDNPSFGRSWMHRESGGNAEPRTQPTVGELAVMLLEQKPAPAVAPSPSEKIGDFVLKFLNDAPRRNE
jgi:hypothetical protein